MQDHLSSDHSDDHRNSENRKSRSFPLWPRSLTGQLLAALLLALLVAQGISIFLFASERSNITVATTRGQILDRTAAVVRLLNESDESMHQRVIRATEGPGILYQLRDKTTLQIPPRGSPEADLTSRLEKRAELPPETVRISKLREGLFRLSRRAEESDDANPSRDDHPISREEFRDLMQRWRDNGKVGPRPIHIRDRRPDLITLDMTLAIPLNSGKWLQVRTGVPTPPKKWGRPFMLSMGIMALLITIIVVLTVRKLTAPLRALEGAARKLGRGESVPPLAEQGPKEVRNTIVAFNAMQERLLRFVQDRTRMLAAVSHDLRTPITTLRLRAEFIDDEEMRDKILATLEEMQSMTDAVLAFAREDATNEETLEMDLAALLSAMVEDYEELGKNVTFKGPDSLVYSCRPISLKRAVRNLVENALRYAGDANITLERQPKSIDIVIHDNGPGIPEDKLDDVFTPFFRVEGSRNLETGGVGLGLSITRTIIRSHGGDITLKNRKDGGLAARISLPH